MIETPPPAVITCPVLDCGWTYDASTPDPRSRQRETLADVFGPGVYAAAVATQGAWELERVLTEHFANHTTAEYVATMASQRGRLETCQADRIRATALAEHYMATLAVLARELRIPAPIGDDLTEWTRQARAAIVRRAGTAASGRGWAQ